MSLSEHSLNDMMPANLSKTFADIKTVADSVAFKRALPRLKTYGGVDTQKKVESLLAANLYALNEFLRLKNGMTNEEIFFTAESIMEEFGYILTFADINIIINRAKRGYYGDYYERLSCGQIMNWCRSYADERMQEAERQSIKEVREEQRKREAYEPKERDLEMIKKLKALVGGKRVDEKISDEGEKEYKEFKKRYLNGQMKI